jgi:hypothetical protein
MHDPTRCQGQRRAKTRSEMSGHTGDDPEDANEADQGPDDDSPDASEPVTPTTSLGAATKTFGEAPHPHHADRGGAPTGP